MQKKQRVLGFRRKDERTIPITERKPKTNKIQPRKQFKPVSPKGTWTPAYREIRRTKDVINTLFEKLTPKQQAAITYSYTLAVAKKQGALAKRRVEAQREMLKAMLKLLNAKCYFCHKPLKANQALTTHHKNKKHNDNRPANKAVCHETCHRKYHYRDVQPKNEPKKKPTKISVYIGKKKIGEAPTVKEAKHLAELEARWFHDGATITWKRVHTSHNSTVRC